MSQSRNKNVIYSKITKIYLLRYFSSDHFSDGFCVGYLERLI